MNIPNADILVKNNYLPFILNLSSDPVKVRWVDIGNDLLKEPFFDTAITAYRERNKMAYLETPLSDMIRLAGKVEVVKRKAFIFHMSRCGSTLLTNMLKRCRKNIVLCEPGLTWEVLDIEDDANREYVELVLKSVIEIFGRRRSPREENMIIKFFSGTTIYLPIILNAFPDVPRMFLYRDPVEVLVSNIQEPAQNWIYHKKLTKLTPEQIAEEMTPSENCAHALANTAKAFLDTYDEKKCLIVNYNQLGRTAFERIMAHFNMDFNDEELNEMLQETVYYSKDASQKFASDTSRKQQLASPKLRSVADSIIGPVYEQLNKLAIQL